MAVPVDALDSPLPESPEGVLPDEPAAPDAAGFAGALLGAAGGVAPPDAMPLAGAGAEVGTGADAVPVLGAAPGVAGAAAAARNAELLAELSLLLSAADGAAVLGVAPATSPSPMPGLALSCLLPLELEQPQNAHSANTDSRFVVFRMGDTFCASRSQQRVY